MNRQQFIGLTLTGLVSIMSLGTLSRGSAWGQTSIDQATLRNTALSKHNTYRTTHHSDAMTISACYLKPGQTRILVDTSSGSDGAINPLCPDSV